MTKRIRTYYIGLLSGLASILLPLLFLFSKGPELSNLDPREHDIQNLLTYFLLLLFSFVNHVRFVPKLYLAKQYVRYGVIILGCILVVGLVPQRIEQWVFLSPPVRSTPAEWIAQLLWRENLFPNRPSESVADRHSPPRHKADGSPLPSNHPPFDPDSDTSSSRHERLAHPPWEGGAVPLPIKFSIILLLCSVSALGSISVQASSRVHQLEVDKLQAELGQLKAQIHPHFLFNTLNSIYALAIRKDDRTADMVVKLAEFMRYMTREASNNEVPLHKELVYIQNYLDLQQARLRHSVQVTYSATGSTNGHQIAPLILFTFIENAFKHGVNPDEDSRIQIAIEITDQGIHLLVENRKVTVRNVETDGGVGLPNTRTRLRLLYPGRHRLVISDQDQIYQVKLLIQF